MVFSPKKESSYEREKRNKFTAQFKAKVALEAIRSDKTLNEIRIEFGVHPSQVGLLKRELLENAPGIFDKNRGLKPVDPSSDPEMLYSEIGRLKFIGFVKKKVALYLRSSVKAVSAAISHYRF